jgi:periplasmic protein TonB
MVYKITLAVFIICLLCLSFSSIDCLAQNSNPVQKFTKPDKHNNNKFIPLYERLVVLKKVQPVYVEIARKNGIQGTIYVEARIMKDGTVSEVKISKNKTGSKELEQAAIDAIKQWTFKPFEHQDSTTSIWATIPIKFKLAKEKK